MSSTDSLAPISALIADSWVGSGPRKLACGAGDLWEIYQLDERGIWERWSGPALASAYARAAMGWAHEPPDGESPSGDLTRLAQVEARKNPRYKRVSGYFAAAILKRTGLLDAPPSGVVWDEEGKTGVARDDRVFSEPCDVLAAVNGLISLKSGLILPPSEAAPYLWRKQDAVPVSYEQVDPTPAYRLFRHIPCSQFRLLLWLVGFALQGRPRFITLLVGEENSGRRTFFRLIQEMLGHNRAVWPSSSLSLKKGQRWMRGPRIALFSDLGGNRAFGSEVVKRWTESDTPENTRPTASLFVSMEPSVAARIKRNLAPDLMSRIYEVRFPPIPSDVLALTGGGGIGRRPVEITKEHAMAALWESVQLAAGPPPPNEPLTGTVADAARGEALP